MLLLEREYLIILAEMEPISSNVNIESTSFRTKAGTFNIKAECTAAYIDDFTETIERIIENCSAGDSFMKEGSYYLVDFDCHALIWLVVSENGEFRCWFVRFETTKEPPTRIVYCGGKSKDVMTVSFFNGYGVDDDFSKIRFPFGCTVDFLVKANDNFVPFTAKFADAKLFADRFLDVHEIHLKKITQQATEKKCARCADKN